MLTKEASPEVQEKDYIRQEELITISVIQLSNWSTGDSSLRRNDGRIVRHAEARKPAPMLSGHLPRFRKKVKFNTEELKIIAVIQQSN